MQFCYRLVLYCFILLLFYFISHVLTTLHILRLKCTKLDFGWGSAPDTAGGAHSAPPDPSAGFKGDCVHHLGGSEALNSLNSSASAFFHPRYMVPRCPLPRCPPLLLGAGLSTPTFSASPGNIRSLKLSLPGTFALWDFSALELSLPWFKY